MSTVDFWSLTSKICFHGVTVQYVPYSHSRFASGETGIITSSYGTMDRRGIPGSARRTHPAVFVIVSIFGEHLPVNLFSR